MRTTRSNDGRSTRPKAALLCVAGVAVALVASCAVTAVVIRTIPPAAVVDHEPVCGATETTSNLGLDALGVGCDDDRRATYHLIQAWPRKQAGVNVGSGEVHVEPGSDQAATWTAIALAESGGSTGT